MMNLEVLFASYAWTGNNTPVDIAVSHADRTNIARPREAERIVVSCGGVQCDDWRGVRGSYSAGV
ncbi:hypothetical protein SCLCIDRAFT_1225161 [Scleroderma citrinum Foug A]|uniref:Uncharacterized protein n=1 Tax=Scleroderma citrinum Foug A TaxID=1036808 RepID=A0A0C3CQ95_9AGAM|nr:hypothetical protein SCLCIDRAFT_1225161 [Scleroderma citrinum Foug A]